jgi:phosphate transport system substrate-binding protein
MKRLMVLLGIIALLIGSTAMVWAESKGGETIVRVAGADSMFFRVRLLGKLFTKANPSIIVDVSQGGTMDSGIRAVIEGQADLAMASCAIREAEDKLATEKGAKLVERLIGHGGITIIANSSAGIDRLTVDEVRKLLTGEYANWKQVGGTDSPVKVIRTDETHPGTLAFLERDFMHAPFVRQAVVVSTFPGVVSKVADTPGAIGYVRIRETTESAVVKTNPRVKVIPLSTSKATVPVLPDRETVANHSYPLVRPYLIYYLSTAKEEAVRFADYVVKKGWGSQDL